jgi:SnoaL-like domain
MAEAPSAGNLIAISIILALAAVAPCGLATASQGVDASTVLAQAQEPRINPAEKGSNAKAACDVPREYVKLINTGQYDAVGGLFADDAVYMGPDGKTRHGAKAIGEFYKQLLGNLRPKLRAASFYERGNECLMELESKSGKSGKYALTAIDHFTVDTQGKISRFVVFLRPGTETGRELNSALSKIH